MIFGTANQPAKKAALLFVAFWLLWAIIGLSIALRGDCQMLHQPDTTLCTNNVGPDQDYSHIVDKGTTSCYFETMTGFAFAATLIGSFLLLLIHLPPDWQKKEEK